MLCVICHETIQSGKGKVMSCGHIFHDQCVQNWFRETPTKTCCYCRAVLDPSKGTTLYFVGDETTETILNTPIRTICFPRNSGLEIENNHLKTRLVNLERENKHLMAILKLHNRIDLLMTHNDVSREDVLLASAPAHSATDIHTGATVTGSAAPAIHRGNISTDSAAAINTGTIATSSTEAALVRRDATVRTDSINAGATATGSPAPAGTLIRRGAITTLSAEASINTGDIATDSAAPINSGAVTTSSTEAALVHRNAAVRTGSINISTRRAAAIRTGSINSHRAAAIRTHTMITRSAAARGRAAGANLSAVATPAETRGATASVIRTSLAAGSSNVHST